MERIIYRKTLDVHKNGIQFTLQGFETADNMSRVIELNLMASGDTVDIPLEGVVAMMYVTTPNANEPSINHCTIRDNTVVYEVLPIVEEGTTEMQLKLVQTDIDGASRVLISPRFAVEVMGSNADDGEAEQTATFTALEDAVARANAVYDKRVDKIDVEPNGIFKVYYADGVVYESDAFRKLLLSENTGIDLDSLIYESLMDFTVEDVADYLDDRYRDIFAKAEKSADLFSTYSKPTFVEWNADTANTPYEAGLTTASKGFALVFGDTSANHTAIVWTVGSEMAAFFIHKYVGGDDNGWDTPITALGGTMSGSLGLGGGKGSVSADDEGSYLESAADDSNGRRINVSNTVPLEEAVSFIEKVDGEQIPHKLIGEHNVEGILGNLMYCKIKVGSYLGGGTKENKILGIPESAKFVLIAKDIDPTWKSFVIRDADRSFPLWQSSGQRCDVTWDGDTLTLTSAYSNETNWDIAMNAKDKKYWYVAIG